MNLGAMRYKSYVWPNNPSHIQLTNRRDVRELRQPFAGAVAQDLGRRMRAVKGSGLFFGDTALPDYARLQSVFACGGAGTLIIPGFDAIWAQFEELEMTQDPGPGMIGYRFAFREQSAAAPPAPPTPASVIAGAGDSLFAVASRYGVSLEQLVLCNPDIRHPFDLIAGRVVRLC